MCILSYRDDFGLQGISSRGSRIYLLGTKMGPSATPIRETPPQAGETAPDFELSDSTGALRRLSELCGAKPLLLLFYRGHW